MFERRTRHVDSTLGTLGTARLPDICIGTYVRYGLQKASICSSSPAMYHDDFVSLGCWAFVFRGDIEILRSLSQQQDKPMPSRHVLEFNLSPRIDFHYIYILYKRRNL